MKAAAVSVWVFINLLCFGMCGYLYLIWSQYWMYTEQQKLLNKTPTLQKSSLSSSSKYIYKSSLVNNSTININVLKKSRRSAVGVLWSNINSKQTNNSTASSIRPAANFIRKSQGSPRFPNTHNPILEFDTDKYICGDDTKECEKKTKDFKELLLKEFHRVLMSESKVFTSGLVSQNSYNVHYEGAKKELSSDEVLCALSRVPVRTIRRQDQPFARLGFGIPSAPLQEGKSFDTCAIVTSAGTLLGSRLGHFIDTHDMVLRFNNAPAENYTDDVGSKTTFRILNSQIVSKPEYSFLEDDMYKNVSIIIWDPANYSSTLEQWYQHPDFPLFSVYKRLLEVRPNTDTHLLHPRVLWQLWTVLQDTSIYRLRKNPPSSGFIGIWFALHRCKIVRVFEYIPSVRASKRCHYYRDAEDTACTLGIWHPLAHEKALVEKLRTNSDAQVFQAGYVELRGFSSISCY